MAANIAIVVFLLAILVIWFLAARITRAIDASVNLGVFDESPPAGAARMPNLTVMVFHPKHWLKWSTSDWLKYIATTESTK